MIPRRWEKLALETWDQTVHNNLHMSLAEDYNRCMLRKDPP